MIASQTNVPTLRFSEFVEEWKNESLSKYIEITSGFAFKSELFSEHGRKLVIPKNFTKYGYGNFSDSNSKYTLESPGERYKCVEGDLLLLLTDLTPSCELLGKPLLIRKADGEAWLNQRIIKIISDEEKLYKVFLLSYFQTEKYHKIIKETATGSTVRHSSNKIINNLYISFPSLPEQQKIASFLTAIDSKIELLTKKKALLEQYKKGVMQQLFSKRIRFKDENGNEYPEWEEKQFEEIFERITRKNKEDNTNVLTISGQQGLVSQLEYFNKSVSAQDLTGYYLLEKGDFAYNKSYSNGYPMGAIKRLTRYNKGVVSTLYICFKAKAGGSIEYYDHYFNSGLLNQEIQKIAQEGARNHGLLNVSVVEFFRDISIVIPSKEEQIKIAKFLDSIDKKINIMHHQIEFTLKYKKSLLQQLFV